MQKHANLVDLVKTQELSNEYFLAKFGVDTAENEPLEGMQRNNNIPLSAILQSVELAKKLDMLA